jgi:hypothetical protein
MGAGLIDSKVEKEVFWTQIALFPNESYVRSFRTTRSLQIVREVERNHVVQRSDKHSCISCLALQKTASLNFVSIHVYRCNCTTVALGTDLRINAKP